MGIQYQQGKRITKETGLKILLVNQNDLDSLFFIIKLKMNIFVDMKNYEFILIDKSTINSNFFVLFSQSFLFLDQRFELKVFSCGLISLIIRSFLLKDELNWDLFPWRLKTLSHHSLFRLNLGLVKMFVFHNPWLFGREFVWQHSFAQLLQSTF